jgi:hypothetical protein
MNVNDDEVFDAVSQAARRCLRLSLSIAWRHGSSPLQHVGQVRAPSEQGLPHQRQLRHPGFR